MFIYIYIYKVRSGKHKERSTRDHILQCDNDLSFDEFTILAHRNKKHLLEIKQSLLIKRDQPVLNKNSSATLHLLDSNFYLFLYSFFIADCNGILTRI